MLNKWIVLENLTKYINKNNLTDYKPQPNKDWVVSFSDKTCTIICINYFEFCLRKENKPNENLSVQFWWFHYLKKIKNKNFIDSWFNSIRNHAHPDT